MPKIELLYFRGCPNVERAREALRSAGYMEFSEVDQGKLPSSHPYLCFSSPTILRDGKLMAGAKSGAAACSVVNWENAELSEAKSSCGCG